MRFAPNIGVKLRQRYFEDKPFLIRPGYHGEWVVDISAVTPWDKIHSIHKWCNEVLGPNGHNPKCRWRRPQLDDFRLYFRHEEDITLFTLRWS